MSAGQKQSLGINADLNEPHPESLPVAVVINDTGEKEVVNPDIATGTALSQTRLGTPNLPTHQEIAQSVVMARQHKDEKTALIAGGVTVGLLTLYFFR